jgi:hypothetical protein
MSSTKTRSYTLFDNVLNLADPQMAGKDWWVNYITVMQARPAAKELYVSDTSGKGTYIEVT